LTSVGAGESGKSTVLKQMRLIHAGGFSKNERKLWRVHIFQNLTNAFQIILDAMEEQDTEFEDDDNYVSSSMSIYCWRDSNALQQWAQLIHSDPDIGPEDDMPYQCLHAFTSLWADKGIQLAMLKGNEYALHDNLN
jgi:guanine nucleotide-binding protein subunit alpha